MKKLAILFVLLSTCVSAQEHAWVYFKDKPDADAFLLAPNLMLSQKSLARRAQQGIDLDASDVPLCPEYVEGVATSIGITVHSRSKWLNALHVSGSEANILNLQNLSFVANVELARNNVIVSQPVLTNLNKTKFSKTERLQKAVSYTYGQALGQTQMLGLETLHEKGFDGKGMQIAVIDGGFLGVDTAGSFSHLLDLDTDNGEILGGYDFVNRTSEVYKANATHGTEVLSTIGAIKENEFVGTAPKASFYLFISEDINSETPLEESLWVEAAERADSLGVDIINTSLGYSQFDEAKYNYTYDDMDGTTTFITRGATLAAKKGIVLVNSAGNSGNSEWKYITAPADAANIISVGAVNTNENIASFSSFGPTADNRVKPETLAQGAGVYVVTKDNEVRTSNGTSFSGPIIAGAVACLWQAYPEKTSLEIRDLVIQNSTNFSNPTSQEGYGILNLSNIAATLTTKNEVLENSVAYRITDTAIFIEGLQDKTVYKAVLYTITGKNIVSTTISVTANEILLTNFKKGVYFLNIESSLETKTIKFIL